MLKRFDCIPLVYLKKIKPNHLTKSAYQLVLGFERVSRIFWAFGNGITFFKA
jgi:hypothetical protein